LTNVNVLHQETLPRSWGNCRLKAGLTHAQETARSIWKASMRFEFNITRLKDSNASGNPINNSVRCLRVGKTPTRVGKLEDVARRLGCARKHPHEREESRSQDWSRKAVWETPPLVGHRSARDRITRSRNTPRVLGKQTIGLCLLDSLENTPTDVGKTAVPRMGG